MTIQIKPGVTESFLVDLPAHPIAAAILLPGGPGRFKIVHNPDGSYSANNNFLSRTRQKLAQAGIATLLLDVPSNHPYGITEWFRGSQANTRNIAAAATWLQQQTGRKVWLVGTSLGTISAASSAIRLGTRIDGLVLTSSISAVGRSAPDGGLAALNLNRIDVPVLVMDDTLDACPISPPQNAAVLARRMTAAPHVSTVLIPAGATPESGPCDPLSYHGYFGAEGPAVSTIIGFITRN
jgi:pimeloyl-ACP methyl ester carboxylesterase